MYILETDNLQSFTIADEPAHVHFLPHNICKKLWVMMIELDMKNLVFRRRLGVLTNDCLGVRLQGGPDPRTSLCSLMHS